ncbi:acyl-coenzyme A oxidase 1 [Dothidotthia symphoricarpi CBS 119687]|uniref:Acyl-coenzyme A oxidase n=1 Tax=Dothidotthia symphoricarpi CBS 119687 TaxID=1392245 RepID=A0A6A6A593_9PLEO|nr:acyl-coenzyme A oxidase 1 [Dothidotthia symphoricarpi CBS 119687]KAF2127162.1 acyl-coenzyme A oxidase 1 [Dothidotthia symphoricarpi CBS 119687]
MSPTPDWVKQLKPSGPQGHELLAAERAGSHVSAEKLEELLHTKETIDVTNRMLKVLKSEKVFDKSHNLFQGRIDRFASALAREKRLRVLKMQHNWSEEEFRTAVNLVGEPGPYGLHDTMFLITLGEQGTPEQQEKWLKPAEKYEIIGCYAQTELGHGSNVRGLETQAIWNPEDKTFTLHSPHLTASKWWIGSLGRTANYAAVMAQLIIDGKSYGPTPFIIQIRDLKTHEPLENVHVGDIGPKFGYNTMDNGFLLFNKLKVPHISMLAKFSHVDPNTNKFQRRGSPSLIYGTLTWVRSNIVKQAGATLARGVTIATRYTAVRRQFQDRDAPAGGSETPVLNYTMVQIRLLPLLAATFALHFTGNSMMELYNENKKKMNQGNANKDPSKTERGAGPEEMNSGSDLLADLHASSCALKSLSSTIAAEGLEVCRRACGGHGYSNFSGIGTWYADYLPTCTWEGDNYMLSQQVARYLLKSARSVLNGQKPTNDTTTILAEFQSRNNIGCAFDIIGSDTDLVAAFAWRVSFLTFEASKHRDEQKKPWNDLLVDFYRLSKAHAQYMVVKSNLSALKQIEKEGRIDSETIEVLMKLFRLFALHTLEQEGSEFYTSGACSKHQIMLARTKTVMKLLQDIRPHAVNLADSWGFDDWLLDSSLGRSDGKVYEDMFYRASELNPLNNYTVDPNPHSNVLYKNVEKSKL